MDLSDRVEILDVMALYGHIVDRRAWDRVHEIVTDDVVFDVSALGPAAGGEREGGREALVAYWSTAPHPPAHHFTNAYIYEEGGIVRSMSKWLCADGTGGVFGGDYDDIWAKTDAGWRIRRRTVTGRHGLAEFQARRPGGAA
jgi:hypothetical protein